ncbi:hypothetical protein DPMN_114791 [Dreissena polymorpha]|uniref:Uncharacterized protein n=1 Tax=Dreissena polymorpha TaxID=45954 RepID=A0A9D4KLA3_DREPO|nr:hypothetical protein DPMN_114791 [Dreissena polymorpha]
MVMVTVRDSDPRTCASVRDLTRAANAPAVHARGASGVWTPATDADATISTV